MKMKNDQTMNQFPGYERGLRRQLIRFGSLSRTLDVPGWYVEGDNEGIHVGDDLAEMEEAYAELRSAYSRRVREFRKRIGLSQEEAGYLIGGGKRAFQKYESGKMEPSEAAVGLIELLIAHPQALETLRAVRAGKEALISPDPTVL